MTYFKDIDLFSSILRVDLIGQGLGLYYPSSGIIISHKEEGRIKISLAREITIDLIENDKEGRIDMDITVEPGMKSISGTSLFQIIPRIPGTTFWVNPGDPFDVFSLKLWSKAICEFLGGTLKEFLYHNLLSVNESWLIKKQGQYIEDLRLASELAEDGRLFVLLRGKGRITSQSLPGLRITVLIHEKTQKEVMIEAEIECYREDPNNLGAIICRIDKTPNFLGRKKEEIWKIPDWSEIDTFILNGISEIIINET